MARSTWKGAFLVLFIVVVEYSVRGQIENEIHVSTTANGLPGPTAGDDNKPSGKILVITASCVTVAVVVAILAAIVVVAIRRRRQNLQNRALRLKTNHTNSFQNMSCLQNGRNQISDNCTSSNINKHQNSSVSIFGSLRELSTHPSEMDSGFPSTADISDGGVSSVSVPAYYKSSQKRIRLVDNIDAKRTSYPVLKDKRPNNEKARFKQRTTSKDSGFQGSRDLSKSILYSNKSLKSLDSTIGDDEQGDVLKTQNVQPGIHDGNKTLIHNRFSSFSSECRQSRKVDTTCCSDSKLQALVAPFINNPSVFTEDDKGERCIYATMSFAIGLFDHKGGMLHLLDKSTQLIIPPGVLRKETFIYFSVTFHSDGSKNGQMSYSPVINLGPDGTTFESPVILSFQHSAILDDGYMSRSLRPVIQQGSDNNWREFTYKETLCTITKDRVIMSMDHFTGVKLAGEGEPIVSTNFNTYENVAFTADDVTGSICTDTDSKRSSAVCSHKGACACPTVNNLSNTVASRNIISPVEYERPNQSALQEPIVRKKSIFPDKLKKYISKSSNPDSSREIAKRIWLFCIVEPCDQIIKLRMYFADTENTMSQIQLLDDAGFRATAPKRFIFCAQDGPLTVKLVDQQLRRKDLSKKILTKEQVLFNPHDHVEFIMSHTSRTYGKVEVYQNKRKSSTIELHPSWGEQKRKVNFIKQECLLAIDDVEIINHVIQSHGRTPVAVNCQSSAIPHDLMMELCKILDPDDFHLTKLADIIGIDQGEFRWFKVRGSVTKTMLSFYQAFYHEDSSNDLLQKLHGHLVKIGHLHAADVVKMFLEEYYKMNNPSSESHSSIDTFSSSTVTCQCTQQSKPVRSFSVLSADSGYTTGLTTP